MYAGSSNGRIWVSIDRGTSFRQSRFETGGAVERIFVDSAAPRVALAVLGGSGARVLRTTSSGTIWDDLTGNLPDGPVHAVTAERASGAVYVATDRGVFWTRTDLESASLPAANWTNLTERLPAAPANWTNLTERLPAAPASDVRLDPAGVYFGTSTGALFASADEGESWNRIAEYLPSILSVETLVIEG